MESNKDVILIVDDVPTNLSVLMQFLESSGYKVLVATDGESAIEQAKYALPHIILLDVMMPGIDGFETIERLKADDATREIPVIFMTALSDTVDKVHGFELGAVDYITKPLQQEEVVARVRIHLTLEHQKQEIQRLRQQDLAHYERLSKIKDEILATTSHDLKNPLTAIMLTVDLLHRQIAADQTHIHEKLDQIQNEANFMHALVSNLLDLARLETGVGLQKQWVSLFQLLERSVNHVASAATAKRILLRLQLPKGDVSLACDPLRIDQALQNLISNALKYTPEGGTVEVKVDVTEPQIQLEVIDTGIGIPEAAIPHLFDRFYRVNTREHMAVSGTGLGLSIVHKVVQLHGGSISVESTPGVGSIFRIALPRVSNGY